MSISEDGKSNINIQITGQGRFDEGMVEELADQLQAEYELPQENLPESTLSTRIDEILWSDCDNCRQIRFGIAIGAIGISLINLISIAALVLWLT